MKDWPRPPKKSGHKARVLCFVRVNKSEHLSPVSYYRGYQPMMALGRHNPFFQTEVWSQADVGRLIGSAGEYADGLLQGRDIYIVSRLYREEGLNVFLDTIRTGGGIAVFDTDDDLTEEFRELGNRGDEFIYTIRQFDAVTVSTSHLAKRLELFLGRKPHVLPNHIDFEWFSRMSLAQTRQVEGLTIGLIGTASHYGDWRYPVEAMVKLKQEYGDAVTILVAGYIPDYLKDIAISLRPVPYSRYPALMRQFDIVCCSLDPDDEFNKSKSAVKALESMASARQLGNGKTGGAVPVCTDMPVYRRVVNKRNGILTSNDDWYTPLKALVDDKFLRQKLSVQGHKWVKKQRDVNANHGNWGRFYRSLMRRDR